MGELTMAVSPRDFKVEPSVLVAKPGSKWAIQVLSMRDGYLIAASPEYAEPIRRLIEAGEWKRWLRAAEGLDKFLRALGMKDMSTAFRESGPSHDVGLLCSRELFNPLQEHARRVVRLTREDTLWPGASSGPSEMPFMYAIVKGGSLVARGTVRRNLSVLDGRTWAMGVWVDEPYRRRGYGKAVVSAATKEVVRAGGIALWNAQADNVASIALAESLGYRRYLCYLRIPKGLRT